MKLLAIPLGCQKTTAKWLVITQQKMLGKSLVIAIPLMNLLAIPLGWQRTPTKWLVISRQKTATKWLVMLRCGKNFLLIYLSYVARQNFFHALYLGEL